MKRFREVVVTSAELVIASSLAVSGLVAQDLPPGILLLSRIKHRVQENVAHLPDYTCLETAQRHLRPAGKQAVSKLHDTVRLEVLYTGKQELYASPGDRDFREDHPSAFTAGGLSGNGLFASFLRTLFVNDHGMFTYRGETAVAGRNLAHYVFRVPLLMSGWTIQTETGSGTVSMKGEIWADPQTRDLVSMEVEADDIPLQLGIESATVFLEYARTRIGTTDVMLPQAGEVSMAYPSGRESRNLIEFTHCRSFQTQSTLNFGPDVPANSPLVASPPHGGVAEPKLTLPPGLPVTIRLTSEIGAHQGVGSLVEGIVSGNVVDKAKKVLISDGARVTGRIRRLEHYEERGGYFMIGIEFTEIRSTAVALRFFADLHSLENRPNIDLMIVDSTTRGSTTINHKITAPDLPGVGVFFIRKPPFTVPAGMRMQWRTRSLAP